MANVPRDGIDLPSPRPRTRARLLDVARDLPSGRWAQGVEWTPWPGLDTQGDTVDCDTVFDKEPREFDELDDQPAFILWDSLQCSTLGYRLSTIAGLLFENLDPDGFLSATLADELESGERSGGASLASTATVVTSAASPLGLAFALLEDHLASVLYGGLGVIHLTPGLYSIAMALGLVDPTTSTTATGHAVIGDAGHSGAVEPADGDAPGDGEKWIYATGDIWYQTSELKGILTTEGPDGGAVYALKNKNRPLAERYAILVFDQNLVGAALVSYAESTD